MTSSGPDLSTRRAFVCGGITALATLALPAGQAAGSASAVGAVQTVAGEAHAIAEGAKRALSTKAGVFVGDLLVTSLDSRLGVALGRLTNLRLGASAQLRIDKYIVDAGGEFTLDGGNLRFERRRTSETPDLLFRSVYGLIAVRGTHFHAGPSRGVFGVFTETGEVAVTAGGRTVVVGRGQGTDIAAVGQPPTAPRSWPRPRVREMIASTG